MNIRELASLLGVSPAAVSIVLNDRQGVSENTRKRIKEGIEKYAYINKQKNRTNLGDIIVLKYWNSSILIEENQGFISMIIDGMEELLRKKQYSMTVTVSKSNLAKTIHEIEYEKYCGMIIIGTEIPKEEYRVLADIPIPFVIMDNTVPNYQYNSVCMNNDENVYLALKYVRECGHRKIGYFRSNIDCQNFAERCRAFRNYTSLLELETNREDEIKLTPALSGAYTDMLKRLKQKKTEPVSCYFADNDTIALGAINALKEYGYNVPEDISVIGFDDIPFASVCSPALTTVHVQRNILSEQTVIQLFQLIESQAYSSLKTRITGKLVERGSVKKLI